MHASVLVLLLFAAAALVVFTQAEGDEQDLDKRHVFAPRVGKHKRAYILRMGKRSDQGVEAAVVGEDDGEEGLDADKRARILRMGKRARILRMG
jgi:hypothetical protein